MALVEVKILFSQRYCSVFSFSFRLFNTIDNPQSAGGSHGLVCECPAMRLLHQQINVLGKTTVNEGIGT
jgi:hypothetical protein